MAQHRYLLALGSNMRHHRHGSPRCVLGAALEAMRAAGITMDDVSPVIETAPLGPSLRRYVNAAALVATDLSPPELLRALHDIEHRFGRRRRGRRWRARSLDLDIVLWSGGLHASGRGEADLAIPHREYRKRSFVLGPASAIAPAWRDPITHFSIQQLQARLTKPRMPPR